jgi:hypothetical protein
VQSIMRSDLNTDLFDVALLAGTLSGRSRGSLETVPFCPLLSQGWSWLRVRNVALSPEAARARDYLRPALWSTFDAGGIAALETEILSTRRK